jgi:hypothetical protein
MVKSLKINTMNRFTIQLILLCIAANIASGQNMKRGYVIKNDGSIQSGWIEHQKWKQAPKEIKFKLDSCSSLITKYTIGQIKYFEILDQVAFFRVPVCHPVIIYENNPEYFFDENSKAVIEGFIDGAPKIIKKILPDTCRMDTVFLKLLLEGDKYSLYQSNDLGDNKMHYYMREANSNNCNELIYCFCNSILHFKTKEHRPFRQYIIDRIGLNYLSKEQVDAINKATPEDFIKLFMVLNQNNAEIITDPGKK